MKTMDKILTDSKAPSDISNSNGILSPLKWHGGQIRPAFPPSRIFPGARGTKKISFFAGTGNHIKRAVRDCFLNIFSVIYLKRKTPEKPGLCLCRCYDPNLVLPIIASYRFNYNSYTRCHVVNSL